MNRRTFLAGLLASTAIPPHLLGYESVASLQASEWTATVSAGTFTPSPITLAALEELAAAVRRSFDPENYRRYLTAASSWEARWGRQSSIPPSGLTHASSMQAYVSAAMWKMIGDRSRPT